MKYYFSPPRVEFKQVAVGKNGVQCVAGRHGFGSVHTYKVEC